ncbi:MAG: FlgD immunoglobulin-like domain containing protein [bacterium]
MIHNRATPASPQFATVLGQLRQAKTSGDPAAVLGWQHELDALTQLPRTGAPPNSPARLVVRDETSFQAGNWEPDIVVSLAMYDDASPALAARADGTLYLVADDKSSNFLDIYCSRDHGWHWEYDFSIQHPNDPSLPCLVIGEGLKNRLLIGFEAGRYSANATLEVHWYDLDTFRFGTTVVESWPSLGIVHPRLCVDSPEYNHWYAYLTYAVGILGKQDWFDIRFSRSLNAGESWQAPITLASRTAHEATPDLDYGGDNLYVTYCKDEAPRHHNVYIRRSSSLGATWDPELLLAAETDDEFDSRVAATNGGDAVVVVYSRDFGTDSDIQEYYSLDAGETWEHHFYPWSYAMEERPALAVAPRFGKIHTAFRRDDGVIYTWADHTDPATWAEVQTVSDFPPSSPDRPGIVCNPAKQTEPGITWSDERIEGESLVYFDARYVLDLVDVSESFRSASALQLQPGYPNPFNPSTTIRFVLPATQPITATIHNTRGHRVTTLLDGVAFAGPHEVTWHGRDDSGRAAASGVYFCRVAGQHCRGEIRLVLVR